MQLIYSGHMDAPGEHCWREPAAGNPMIWKGHAAWYFVAPDGMVKYLCDLAFSDGDAITLYRAKVRILEARSAQS